MSLRHWVDDHGVGSFERLVQPLDVLALEVRLPADGPEPELLCPLFDLSYQLGQGERAVVLGVAAAEHVQVDSVQDVYAHEGSLVIAAPAKAPLPYLLRSFDA